MTDRLLNTRQVAERYGVSPETILRWWRCGKLPGYRLASNVLRFDPAEVDAFLAARHRGGSPEGRATDPRDPRPAGVVSLSRPTPVQGGTTDAC